MPLTIQDHQWFDVFETMPMRDRFTIEAAIDQVQQVLKAEGHKAAQDDRSVALVAAITRYVKESNNEDIRKTEDVS